MKKNKNMGFLIKSMGPFRITLVLSVIVASMSAVMSIYAYTYVYKIMEEIAKHLGQINRIDTDYVSACGKNMVSAICGAFGLYGFALLFSHIT
nr:ABC transporter ATP-binding protein [Lachnospiraceae bacterium]